MTNEKDVEEIMTALGQALDEMLPEFLGERYGFCLLVFPFYRAGLTNYISNTQRQDMIKALREGAERLEAGENIPKTIGPEQ